MAAPSCFDVHFLCSSAARNSMNKFRCLELTGSTSYVTCILAQAAAAAAFLSRAFFLRNAKGQRSQSEMSDGREGTFSCLVLGETRPAPV